MEVSEDRVLLAFADGNVSAAVSKQQFWPLVIDGLLLLSLVLSLLALLASLVLLALQAAGDDENRPEAKWVIIGRVAVRLVVGAGSFFVALLGVRADAQWGYALASWILLLFVLGRFDVPVWEVVGRRLGLERWVKNWKRRGTMLGDGIIRRARSVWPFEDGSRERQ